MLAAAFATGCAPLPTRSLSSSHAEAAAIVHREIAAPSKAAFVPVNDTAAKRADTLDRVWRTIEDFYFDRGFVAGQLPAIVERSRVEASAARSDADFYRVLKAGVGALPDSHSGVLTPREAERASTERDIRIGLSYFVVEGRIVIGEVVPGSPAAEQGIARGAIIDAVDDFALDATFMPIASADQAAVDARESLLLALAEHLLDFGSAPSHRLTLRQPDDRVMQVTVAARLSDLPTIGTVRVLPSGIGVLRLSRFDPSVMAELERGIARIRDASAALILDLRDNPGGDADVFEELVEQFLPRPVGLGTFSTRFWRIPIEMTIDGDPVRHPYLQPLAVLIDGGTASAAELTAHALVELRDAIPVGEATCGCVVGLTREFVLPDGGALFVAEASFTSPHGRRMEHDPLLPVVTATPTLAEARAGDDVVLRAAEHALLARVGAAGDPGHAP